MVPVGPGRGQPFEVNEADVVWATVILSQLWMTDLSGFLQEESQPTTG